MKYFLLCCVIAIVCNNAQAQNNIDTLLQEDDRIFVRTELMPSFPGGDTALLNYVNLHLNRGLLRKNGSPAGKYQVRVRMIISKNGYPFEFVAETKHGYGIEEEIIRIFRSSKWIPAKQNSFTVQCYYRTPVTIELKAQE